MDLGENLFPERRLPSESDIELGEPRTQNSKIRRTNTTNWNPNIELYLDSIRKKCIVFRDIHEHSAILIETRLNYLTFIMIIIALIVALIISLPILSCDDWYKYLASSLSILTATLASMNKFLNYQEFATRHRIGSQRFLELNQNITEELLTDIRDRTQAIQFIKMTGATFIQIRKALPFPPAKILNKYNVNTNGMNSSDYYDPNTNTNNTNNTESNDNGDLENQVEATLNDYQRLQFSRMNYST